MEIKPGSGVTTISVMTSVEDYRMDSYEQVRACIRQFVREREWEKFHTPRNVALALSGEVGELQEIFQWKGDNDDIPKLSAKELEHVGEECSDVMLYTHRLFDLCSLDLALCAQRVVPHRETPFVTYPAGKWDKPWRHVSFDVMLAEMEVAADGQGRGHDKHNESYILSGEEGTGDRGEGLSANNRIIHSSIVRDIVFQIGSECGKINECFRGTTARDCVYLNGWTNEAKAVLATTGGSITLLLLRLTQLLGLEMASCLRDKMTKNNRKYPAHLVRGKSGKYTVYAQTIAHQSQAQKNFYVLGGCTLLAVICFLSGRASAIKR